MQRELDSEENMPARANEQKKEKGIKLKEAVDDFDERVDTKI